MPESRRSIKFHQSALDNMLRRPTGTVGQFLGKYGRAATLEARNLADAELNRKDGTYHNGFVSQVMTTGGELRLRTSNRAPHATYIEAGTQPHVIVVKNAKALHWKDSTGDHFATTVHHPGTRAYRILERAVRKAARRFL
jgi:hypothetical protein